VCGLVASAPAKTLPLIRGGANRLYKEVVMDRGARAMPRENFRVGLISAWSQADFPDDHTIAVITPAPQSRRVGVSA